MNPTDIHHDRAMILFQQRRYDDAERELRSALGQQPHDPRLHAVLAMTLAHQDRFADASAEADQAVGLGPDLAFAHFVRGLVLLMRHRHNEAEAPAAQAVALNPYDAEYHWLLGAIQFEQRKYPIALESADLGLSIDPEHAGCINLRAMTLVKLGRKDEAGQAIDAALAKDPENAHTHANRGWTLLHQGDHKKALEHFREALRLDPELDWARAGIVEALKAKNPIYRVLLRYFLWSGNLSPGAQWGIVIGGYLGFRGLSSIAASNPAAATYIRPVLIAYVVFAIMTWLADPLFNLLLRLSKFGRYALSKRQTWASNVLGTLIAGCAASAIAGLATGNFAWFVLAIALGGLTLPAAGCFRLAKGWPTNAMVAGTGVLALAGLSAAGLMFVIEASPEPTNAAELTAMASLSGTFQSIFNFFAFGILISQFAFNYLRGIQPPK